MPTFEVTLTVREHAVVEADDELAAQTKAFALREERGRLPFKGSSTTVKEVKSGKSGAEEESADDPE